MRGSFAITALPEQAPRFGATHAVVAVDVFRATTTIVTALAQGRRVFPVCSEAQALEVASAGQPLPPVGFVADLGHAALGADWEAKSGREAVPLPAAGRERR